MLNRLIRWLARAEIAAAMNSSYVEGFRIGRAIGHGEMLQHLRGDPDERATSEMVQRRAAELVH